MSKCGESYRGLPIISFKELKERFKDSLIVIATKKYSRQLQKQLLENDFRSDQIILNEFGIGLATYIRDGSQSCVEGLKHHGSPQNLLEILLDNQQKVSDAYHLLADQKSKKLFISRLASLVYYNNIELLNRFMLSYSEPVCQFGEDPWESAPENHFYFNNDVFSLTENEVLVDVGAFDGDSIEAFVQTCNSSYGHIYAFEPDPNNFQLLHQSTNKMNNISCHQIGLWSEARVVPFVSSGKAFLKSTTEIREEGDIEIQVVSLDEFLKGKKVTLIKMDPSGGYEVISEAIKGAAKTIATYKPKLALGAYHSFISIYEMPLLVHRICPEYKLYLRHHSWCINETDLLAYV